MSSFDLVVRNGKVVTGDGTTETGLDIGITGSTISAIGRGLDGQQEIDASGKIVVPGGIDAHCHIEQSSSFGLMGADDFHSGSVSAAFGGNTTIVPFAAQHRGQALPGVLEDYHARARSKSILDYSFHIIVSDPTEELLEHHLPEAIRSGLPSVKLFTAYDLMAVADEQFLDVLSVCRAHNALAMVHAENNAIIKWMGKRLVERGYIEPRYHAVSHPKLAEIEAVQRVLALTATADGSLVVVHVSCVESLEAITRARAAGVDVTCETCPQYLFLTRENADLPGYEGAKFIFSPPPRGPEEQSALWEALGDGRIQLYSSDHAPYRMDASGKFARSQAPTFKDIASGTPGIELRLPLLFSEGVRKGRISLEEFVALGATNAAQLYGMYPRKGVIAEGSDADIAIWDPDKEFTVSGDMLHDNVGYTPYEGMVLTGLPAVVLRRGEVVVNRGELVAARGSGAFIPRAGHERPENCRLAPDVDPENCFGADLLTEGARAGQS